MRPTRPSTLLTALLLALGLCAGSALAKARPPLQSPKAVELHETLRDLWVDHIFWERAAACSARAGDAAAAKVAEERSAQNARALGALLATYYGKDTGDGLVGLLGDHDAAVREYRNATFAGGAAAGEAAAKKLAANAHELASFFNGLNPNWPLVGLVSLFSAHASQHVRQIDSLKAGSCAVEADIWDSLKKGAYDLADELAQGIAQQFSRKFPKNGP